MNADYRVIAWLWQAGRWRGICESFGKAQSDAEWCIRHGAGSAVVESVIVAPNPETWEREYVPTGRSCSGVARSGTVRWSEIARNSRAS
ncbi:MAG TPA: hypothetical protein VGG75_02890 [Trebonia sp.]|jgi:hypothetical protein